MTCAECRDALNAFADGELLPEEMELVRAHLGSCAACAERSRVVSELSQRLKANLIRYPAPDVLKARIRADVAAVASGPSAHPSRAARATPAWVRMAVVASFTAVASSVITLGVARSSAAGSMSDQVFVSHIRSLMPGHLTDVASTAQHEVKPWFNGRVDFAPAVPNLDSAGFPLLGGRLDYVDGHPAAVVVYGRRKHIINVFSWPMARGDQPPKSFTRNGYNVVHQRQGGIDQWLVSDLNDTELEDLARRLRALR